MALRAEAGRVQALREQGLVPPGGADGGLVPVEPYLAGPAVGLGRVDARRDEPTEARFEEPAPAGHAPAYTEPVYRSGVPPETVVEAALAKLRAERLVANVSRQEPLLVVGGWGERWADGLHVYDEPFVISETGKLAELYFAGIEGVEGGAKRVAVENATLEHALHTVLAAYRRRHPRPVFESFDAYARAYPESERFRDWLTNRGTRHDLALLPADPDQGCQLPGGYNWATLGWYNDVGGDTSWYIIVHDSDDGACRKYVADAHEAKQEFANLKLLAPFALYELTAFGYQAE